MFEHSHSGAVTINVAKMFLQETGTYNPMYARPYKVDTSSGQLDTVMNRLNQQVGAVSGEAFAGAASNLLSPVANVNENNLAVIPNGWNDRRIRFVLEVHVTTRTGSTSIYYFQGFTSHAGVSMHGTVDPSMRFYVNSYIRVGRFQQQTPLGVQLVDVVQESAQVLNGQLLYTGGNEVHRLRPSDLFAGIQQNHLQAANYGDVIDTRTISSRGQESFGNRRTNNMPGNYLASVMNSYNHAQQLSHFGQGNDNILARAQSTELGQESMPEENAVLRTLASIQGRRTTVDFSLNDLTAMDPNTPTVTKMSSMSVAARSELHSTGQTAYWNDSTRETVFATQLGNAIPALMMEHFISKLTFSASNKMGMGQSVCQELAATSLTNADMTRYISRLMARIKNEVLFDLSFANQDPYDLVMDVDLLGQTTIDLQMYNNPFVRFSIPSFGDSLISPVYTRDFNQFTGLTNDVEHITNYLKEAVAPVQAVNMNI